MLLFVSALLPFDWVGGDEKLSAVPVLAPWVLDASSGCSMDCLVHVVCRGTAVSEYPASFNWVGGDEQYVRLVVL
jgi:hypothetical protein